jgi:hypothetical protein
MKAFTFGHWHAWQGTAHILLSDQDTQHLRYFGTLDECVNWLYLNGDKPAARALNAHAKVKV